MEAPQQHSPPPPRQQRCQFWIPTKRRFCANSPLPASLFCGNHNPSSEGQRLPCPLDPSHSVLKGKLDAHLRKCPLRKQARELEAQPFYQKGINCCGGGEGEGFVISEAKRSKIYGLTVLEFFDLIRRIKCLHSSLRKEVDLRESYVLPESCAAWVEGRGGVEGQQQLPFREKHALQQASILGNMEAFGVLQRPAAGPGGGDCTEDGCGSCRDVGRIGAVVEFGAGRGYLTQMLADCYGIERVFLVERRSYKLKLGFFGICKMYELALMECVDDEEEKQILMQNPKGLGFLIHADRSLRQKEGIALERLRIDIEDLNLNGVESLRGLPYLAVGKHLCGPAIDLTLRCCLTEEYPNDSCNHSCGTGCPQGLALATCCHHLCQWDQYINKMYFSKIGIKKEDFNAITWFSSWAVDGDHSLELSNAMDQEQHPIGTGDCNTDGKGVEEAVKHMNSGEKALLGFICKEIIDIGRLLWLKERGLDADLVKYVPPDVSPENNLLIAQSTKRS